MKKLLLAALSLLSVSVFASPGTIVKGDVLSGFQNLLTNPSFDMSTFSTGWTTATITSAASTAVLAPGQGRQSAQLTYASQIGSIWQLVTPPSGVQTNGVNMQASAWVDTTVSSIQVCALANGTTASCSNAPASGTWQYVTANFAGPPNGESVGISIQSSSSATGTAWADGAYVGPATNLALGYLATDWSNSLSFTPNGFGTVTNNTWYTRRVGDTLEVIGYWTDGTVAASTASLTLPTGYTIDSTKLGSLTNSTFLGMYTVQSSSSGVKFATNDNISVVFYDGSTTNTVFLTNQSTTGAYNKVNGSTLGNSNEPVNVFFKIPILGWSSSQAAYRADITPAGYSGTLTAGAAWSTTNSSFADVTATSSLTQVTNVNFGTVTQADGANGYPGIVFTPPRTGVYTVCFNGTIKASTTGVAGFRLYDGANTWIPEIDLDVGSSVSGIEVPITPCAQYSVTSLSSITLRAQLKISAGTATLCSATGATCGISIAEGTAPMPAPYLTGSVTSTTTGQEHIERATIANNGSSASITSQSGSWVSSVSRSSAGVVVVNFTSGEFSSQPSCTAMALDTGGIGSSVNCDRVSAASSSSFTFTCDNAGSGLVDVNFSIICMGPH